MGHFAPQFLELGKSPVQTGSTVYPIKSQYENSYHYTEIVTAFKSKNHSNLIFIIPMFWYKCFHIIPSPSNKISNFSVLCDIIITRRYWHRDYMSSLLAKKARIVYTDAFLSGENKNLSYSGYNNQENISISKLISQ